MLAIGTAWTWGIVRQSGVIIGHWNFLFKGGYVCKCVQTALVVNECQLHTSEHMTKTSAISVRVTEETKKAVENAAKDDGRSVASYVERLLSEHLNTIGQLPQAKT